MFESKCDHCYTHVTIATETSNVFHVFDAVKDIETIHKKSINAFIANDRLQAINAIKIHRKYLKEITDFRSLLEHKKQIPIDFLDIVYMFERIT